MSTSFREGVPERGAIGAASISGKERLEKIQADLSSIRRGIQRSTVITTVVGIILLAVLCFYFSYGLSIAKETTEPDKLVNLLGQTVEDNLPRLRGDLEKHIIEESPKWAADLNAQALKSIPDGRAKLEKFVLEQMDETLKNANVAGEDEFRKFLQEHKPMLDKQFAELSSSPKVSESALDEMVQAMEEKFQVRFQENAVSYLGALKDTNEYWKAVKDEKDMDEEMRLVRRAATLFRRLYLEQLEPDKLNVVKEIPTPRDSRVLTAKVKSFDADKGVLVAEVPPFKNSTKTFSVNKSAKIKSYGKADAPLTELKEGAAVILTLSPDGKTVDALSLRMTGKVQAPYRPTTNVRINPKTTADKKAPPADQKKQTDKTKSK